MSTYTTRTYLERMFGIANITDWADLENDGDTAKITAVVDDAIERASEWIDTRLREGPYTVPFSDDPGQPAFIREIATRLAGCNLYENRGVQDVAGESQSGAPTHRLSWHRQKAEHDLTALLQGRMTLGIARSKNIPEVVKDESASSRDELRSV